MYMWYVLRLSRIIALQIKRGLKVGPIMVRRVVVRLVASTMLIDGLGAAFPWPGESVHKYTRLGALSVKPGTLHRSTKLAQQEKIRFVYQESRVKEPG